MVRNDPYITVPTYFRCPISLDLMKSPVSLCTGVTYDRSSIQRWLDDGNNTCPATMQVLQTKELVPNHTLRRLIEIWTDSGAAQTSSPPPELLTAAEAARLVDRMEIDLRMFENNSRGTVRRCLSRLSSFAAESEENRRLVAVTSGRILPLVAAVIGKVRLDLGFLEEIIVYCNVLLRNRVRGRDSDEQEIGFKSRIETGENEFKNSILIGLKEGRIELRTAIAEFLELMAAYSCLETHSSPISDDEEIYSELLRLLTFSDRNPVAMDASLTFLTRLAQLKRNRSRMVRARGVRTLAALLAEAELSAPVTEKILKLLEMISASTEGRNEICVNEACVREVVKKVLKVSAATTEHAVRVLWRVCYLAGDKRAAATVAEGNGMAKVLLILQSNCSPAVRQMCVDLLRCSSGKKSCVSWYDTKTTHIMPF